MNKTNIDDDIEMWEEYGYYTHFDTNDGNINYHTHGILYSRGKYDLRITDPIKPEIADVIFYIVVYMMDNKIEIKDGSSFANI